MAEPLDLASLGITVLERGWLSANSVVSADKQHAAIVDTGYATQADLTVALVSHLLGPRSLDWIVNTHLHSDHCGGNAALKSCWPNARTVIPAGQAEAVLRWDTSALTYTPTGQHCPRFVHDAVIAPGNQLELPGSGHWQVHAAPGHDPNAVVLFHSAARILISGDALWLNGFGVVFPELEGQHAFFEVGATFDVIESLNPRLVIPGHGPMITEQELPAALARARSRLDLFVSDPVRHSRHALKVLIKFKLIEWQRVAREEIERWFLSNPYFEQVARDAGYPSTIAAMTDILNDLAQQGQLRITPGSIENA